MMKKLLLLYLLPFAINAAPFAQSDYTQQDVTHCVRSLDAVADIDVPVDVDATLGKRCKFDLAGISAGSHTISAAYVKIDAIYGRGTPSADSAPLVFTKPDLSVAPSAPTKIIISK